MLINARKLKIGALNPGPVYKTHRTAVSKRDIKTADFRSTINRAAITGISQNWNHKPGKNEGTVNPEKRGFRTKEIAAKMIINEIFLESNLSTFFFHSNPWLYMVNSMLNFVNVFWGKIKQLLP